MTNTPTTDSRVGELSADRDRLIHILVVHYDMFRDKAEEAADLFLHHKTLTSPAQETVTDDMVEAAAEVMWNDIFGARAGAWDNPPADSVSGIQFRATSRAALTAALSSKGA